MMRRMVLLMLGLLLGGCVWMNPITAARLATLNPLEADPSVMAVQLDLPDGIDVVEGSAELSLEVMAADGTSIEGEYPLQRLGDVWIVPDAVQDRMRRDIAQARSWERDDPDGTRGSFSAAFGPCITGDGPDRGARFTLALQLEPDGAFLPLFDNVRLANIVEDGDLSQLAPCVAND